MAAAQPPVELGARWSGDEDGTTGFHVFSRL
jgi:hypothetical protein